VAVLALALALAVRAALGRPMGVVL
jgi:hypothetical protein